MAKDYLAIYNSANDASAIEQRFYAVLESQRGVLNGPANTDFFFTLGGGSIAYAQPFETSPHRSGRHHNNIIKKKKTLSWSFDTYFNIDETLGSASTSEIDVAIRMLWKSLLGKEDITGGSPVYTSATAPDLTFSIHETGDKWARQGRGCFVQSGNCQFPGNGEATISWAGAGAEAYLVGIGKLSAASTSNDVVLQSGEGKRFPVGSLVMLIDGTDGVTRSADTAAGTWRVVTAVSGDTVTLSGAALTAAPLDSLLVYYEPDAPAAIDNPVTGLVGSFSIADHGDLDCARSASLNISNDHEAVDYCYGTDALAGSYFLPGSRVTGELSIELNMNDDLVEFFNAVQAFEAQDIDLVLGDAAGRHFKLDIPKVQFPVPEWAVPENGSIPVTFTGTPLQTALDAADEFTASFL